MLDTNILQENCLLHLHVNVLIYVIADRKKLRFNKLPSVLKQKVPVFLI